MRAFSGLLDEAVCELVARTLLHSLWQVTLIALVIAGIRQIQMPAGRRYTCNLVGLCLAALCLPVTFGILANTAENGRPTAVMPDPIPQANDTSLNAAERDDSVARTETILEPPIRNSEATAATGTAPANSVVSDPAPSSDISIDNHQSPESSVTSTWSGASIIRLIVALYVFGVLCCGIRLLRGFRSSWRLRSSARRHPRADLCELAATIGQRLGTGIRPLVGTCTQIAVPAVSGLVRPVILIPAACVTGLSAEMIEAILVHEITHLSRRDHYVLVIQRTAESILFFHPLMWWLSLNLSTEREFACDDAVVQSGVDRVCYAESLLQLARLCSGQPSVRPLLALDGGRRRELVQRVERILGTAETESRSKHNPDAPVDAPNSAVTHRVVGLNMFQHAAGMLLLTVLIATLATGWQSLRAEPTNARLVGAAAAQDQESADGPPDSRSGEAPAVIPPAGDKSTATNEPGHLLTIVNGNELILADIPDLQDNDRTIRTRSVKQNLRGARNLRAIGVYGGHLVALDGPTLTAIDLESGVVRQLVHAWVHNAVLSGPHLYVVKALPDQEDGERRNSLEHIDLSTMNVTTLCTLKNHKLVGFAFNPGDVSIAASPDGTHVAVTESAEPDDEGQILSPPVRIVVASRMNGSVQRPQQLIPSRRHMTGGGDHIIAPKLAWLHDGVIVIAAPKQTDRLGDPLMAPTPLELTTLDITTGTFEPLCPLPEFSQRMHEPWFSPNLILGRRMIHLGELGQYAIVPDRKTITESSRLGAAYTLESADGRTSLKHGDVVLEADTLPERVFPSENGSRIAWMPTDIGPYPNGPTVIGIQNRPTALKVHAPGRGVMTVVEGKFPRSWQRPQQPLLNLCVWLTTEQRRRSDSFDQLMQIADPQPTARVDTRPDIKTAMDVSISTDRKIYQRHEPLIFTITLKNLSDELVRFETKRLLGGAQPFDIDIKSERARDRIELYDYDLNRPEEEFLDLPPGEVVTLTRTIEVEELGKQKLRLRFEHYSLWAGPFKVEAEFEVLEQTTPELLKQKFDRLMALCRLQYQQSPQHVASSCFWQLGEDGGPLLVDFLRDCDDGVFRQALGRGLSQLASESTMPYLKELVPTDLTYDGVMVADSLYRLSKLRTGADDANSREARRLLFTVGQHPNANVRRRVVESLTDVINEDVDRFMLQATGDEVTAIAETAARYVAMRRQMTLEQWFESASRNVTPSNLIAARSIARELEQSRNIRLAQFPSGSAAEIAADSKTTAAYVTAMQEWRQWCAENPRTSNTFFDKAREKAQKMQMIFKVWGDAGPPPIQISE